MIGYHLSSEEHGPTDLVDQARRAEEVGFGFAQISDHFHPWISSQGESPFVWSVLGSIAEATRRLEIGTAVTCPTIRMHPAITAHAAATAAVQLEGRFFFGVGSGERLNEHVLGDRWPPPSVRLEMLEEAIGVMRRLWSGRMVTHHGRHYTVENARLFTLPGEPPPVYVSAFGPEAVEVAARSGDGLMSTGADTETIEQYRERGGRGPTYTMVHVCAARDREQALAVARERWLNSVVPGPAGRELSIPEHFEPFASVFGDEHFEGSFVLGDDPDEHVREIRRHLDAGYDHVALHQIGPDQETFFRLYEEEVLPRLGEPVRAA